VDLHVNRKDLHDTRVVDRPPAPLEPGQARLRVAAFGLSANNITYAVMGDLMQYWDFFPADEGWGRVPVWGYAEVVESRHDGVAPGTRVFGFLPMSDELVITVGKVDAGGFTDGAEHRTHLAGAYNRYLIAEPDVEPGSAGEDRRMLLFPLFFTSFLVDDFLADNGWFGAGTVVISSASAKTALGVAYQVAPREGVEVVGLTSPGNVEFTRSLGVYDLVVPYGSYAELPSGTAVYVDVSGSDAVRVGVHEHYRDDLRHDMILGGTHWEAIGGRTAELPGPKPAFFFAPGQIATRSAEWGQDVLDRALEEAWARYAPWAAGWIELRHAAGPEAIARTYLELLDNQADPRVGHILAPSGTD